MQVLSAKLVLTGVLATLLWAVPVSIDLGRPGSANTSMSPALGIGLKINSAEARMGRPATAGSVAGVARRTTRRTVRRVGYGAPVAAGAVVAGTAVAVGAAAAPHARCTTVVTPGGAVRRCARAY
jgi:hypothetical protein